MSSIKVEGMRCNHCSQAISKAMEATGKAHNIQIDLEAKNVSWEGEMSLEEAKDIIDNQGFDAIL